MTRPGHADAEAAVDAELAGELDERVDERIETVVAAGRRSPGLGDDRAGVVERDAQRLGPTDVDADADAGRRSRFGANLQLSHGVEDAHLGAPLDEAGQRDDEVDREVVAHLGLAVGVSG